MAAFELDAKIAFDRLFIADFVLTGGQVSVELEQGALELSDLNA